MVNFFIAKRCYIKALLVLVVMAVVIVPFNTSMAAANKHKNCAIIIGEADFKTRSYMAYLDKFFADYDFESGETAQNMYMDYWLNQGELEEGKLNKAVMLDIAKTSGYDKVLFLVINSSVVEKNKTEIGTWMGYEYTRANIEVKALLVDSEKIIKSASKVEEDTSSTSELRAKRGAFKQCIKSITEDIEPYVK